MSHWLTIGGPIVAVLTALAIAACVTLIGHDSEDTDAARRRRALGRAASRARAQAPTPLQLPWISHRRRFGRRVKPGGPMIRISGSWGTLEAPAEAIHWDRLFGVTIKRPAYTDAVRSIMEDVELAPLARIPVDRWCRKHRSIAYAGWERCGLGPKWKGSPLSCELVPLDDQAREYSENELARRVAQQQLHELPHDLRKSGLAARLEHELGGDAA